MKNKNFNHEIFNLGYDDYFYDEIIKVIKQYWEWLKYSISDKWEVKFQFNENWLPEWLEVHPDLQNFIKIWLCRFKRICKRFSNYECRRILWMDGSK